MASITNFQTIDDKTVLRILSHLTEQLREELSDEDKIKVQSSDEARSAIASLLEVYNVSGSQTQQEMLPDEATSLVSARALLELFYEDEMIRPQVEEFIAYPPEDSQKSVELALASAIILGGLITWLQTKIDIYISRKDGKTEFTFSAKKSATKTSLIKDVVKQVSKVL